MAVVPISPEVLRWAREFRGLDEAAASKRLGISVSDLRAYETGSQLPTVTVFEQFASRYKLPQATLFRRTPPKVPPAPIDFRTFGGDRRKESFEYRVALSEVRAFLTELRKIARDDEEFRYPSLPAYTQAVAPEALGAKERERLGITPEEQLAWPSAQGFSRWRSIIEAQGVSVFLKKYPLEDSRGFSLYDDDATPAIVINKNEDATVARTFSLAHEYGHLLIRRPGVSDENPKNPVEAYCNRFAGSFLMPDAALRKVLPVWPNRPVDWDRNDIRNWARRLKVSQPALALRLEQAGLAPDGFFGRYSRLNFPPRARLIEGKPNQLVIRLSELGGNYQAAIMGALDRAAIDEVTAVQALGVKAENFEKVRENVKRLSALAGASK